MEKTYLKQSNAGNLTIVFNHVRRLARISNKDATQVVLLTFAVIAYKAMNLI